MNTQSHIRNAKFQYITLSLLSFQLSYDPNFTTFFSTMTIILNLHFYLFLSAILHASHTLLTDTDKIHFSSPNTLNYKYHLYPIHSNETEL
jgi:hypothetical protein